MSTTNFPEYVRTVTNILDSLVATGQAKMVDLKVDQRSILRGLIIGSVFFENDTELHFREFVDVPSPNQNLPLLSITMIVTKS